MKETDEQKIIVKGLKPMVPKGKVHKNDLYAFQSEGCDYGHKTGNIPEKVWLLLHLAQVEKWP